MACRLCQLQTASTLCEVCRFLVEENPAVLPATCERCRAPLADGPASQGLCGVCAAMLDAVRENRWFFRAHVEWEQENIQLARKKMELMGIVSPPLF